MKIIHQDGLLFTTLEIKYQGKKKMIKKIVIDTGVQTIISPDAVFDIGIKYGLGDRIVGAYGIGGRQYAFEKQVEAVRFDSFSIGPCNIDFGLIDTEGNINGLLGLDLLMEAGVVIDFKNLMIYEAI